MTAIAGVSSLDGSLESDVRAAFERSHGRRAAVCVAGTDSSVFASGASPQVALVTDGAGRVVVADARIDNRGDLRRMLRTDADSDARLILAAYDRWGAECVDRLFGDFAFALWDEPRRMLLCARDPMGVRPFYYHRSASTLRFASDLRTLLAMPGVPSSVDDQRVAEFVLNVYADRERTFYSGIRRLPAAHRLVVTPGCTALERYWELDAQREVRPNRPEQYAEEFRDLFRDAVRSRMATDAPTAAALSGGLDSSSIVCTARAMTDGSAGDLHSISLVFPDLPPADLRRIDERSYIAAVTQQGGLTPHVVRGDRISPLHDARRIVNVLQEPYATPNLYLHWAMYGEAADAGAEVFLDGFDGDSAVGHGLARLDALLADDDWTAYEREVRAFAQRRGIAPSAVARSHGLPRLAWLAHEGRWLRWGREALRHHRAFGFSRREIALDFGLRASRRADMRARATDVSERVVRNAPPQPAPVPQRPLPPREAHIAGLMQPAYQSTLEIAAHCSAAFGVDARYPFFDRRLIEFCVALPDEQKLADGWTRRVLRDAMDGVLPTEVQRRPDKGNLLPAFHRGFRSDDAAVLRGLDVRLLEPYADVDLVVRLRSEYAASADPERTHPDPLLLFRLATLAVWLEERGTGQLPHPPVDVDAHALAGAL